MKPIHELTAAQIKDLLSAARYGYHSQYSEVELDARLAELTAPALRLVADSCAECFGDGIVNTGGSYPGDDFWEDCQACRPAPAVWLSDVLTVESGSTLAYVPACDTCHGTGVVADWVDTGAPGVGFSAQVPCECQLATARAITGTGDWCEECFSDVCAHALPNNDRAIHQALVEMAERFQRTVVFNHRTFADCAFGEASRFRRELDAIRAEFALRCTYADLDAMPVAA